MRTMLIKTKFLQQKISILFFIGLFSLHLQAGAAEQNSFQTQIVNGIKTFIDSEAQLLEDKDQGLLSYEIRGLDSRLRLKKCSLPLNINTTQHTLGCESELT